MQHASHVFAHAPHRVRTGWHARPFDSREHLDEPQICVTPRRYS